MHRHTHNHNHSQGSLPRGRPVIPEEGAKASDWFEQFLTAPTLKTIFGSYRNICEYLHLKPNVLPLFYPKLKNHINSWKAKPLWKKFDTRANQKCYGRGKACPHTRVLIIGAGPCGLRTAIEAQLLGAKVVVVEKRDRMSRNNVLHLWPFVIDDLRALGAKKFFGKFCAGSIDHISIRQLQCILLKVALLLGVEIHTEVSFERLIEPNPNEKTGWRAEFKPAEHPVSQFEFDVIIGADGKRNTLQGFKRKEFRGKLAIAITANFINKRTEAEARVEEISGVAFIFNQKFFKDLYAETGIDLENIVYYKDDTHYFVMTAKKQSLIDKGVIKEDLADTARLLAPDNVDREELMNYAREAAEFSTNYQMPDLEFAVNHYGHPDVAMFDFTSMYAAENASRVIERHNYKLLSILVGDSLLEPFWPTGSGCARGFLSSMDAAWAIRSWDSDTVTPLEVIAERESIYRLLAQTTPENLNKDYKSYTLDPSTRYPNLNKNALLAHQVTNLYDTDDPKSIELNPRPAPAIVEVPKKRRRRESHVDPDTLLSWIKEQVREHEDLEVTNLTTSFRDGRVLCAIISHYRPDLLDYSAINAHDFVRNNQVVFDLLEKELGVPPIMTGEEMAENDSPDFLTMLAYLTKVYDTFRCEIPHIKYPKWDKNLTITRTSAVILPSFEYPLKPLLITPHSSAKVSDEGTDYGLSSEKSFPTSILTPNNTKVTTQDNLILIPIKSIEDYLLKDGVEVAKKSDDEILILKDVLDSTENIEGANSSKCRLSKSDPLFSSIHNSSKSSKVSIVCKKLPVLKRNSTKSITSRNSTEQKQKRNKYTQSKRDMVRYLSDDTSQNISGIVFDYSGDYINDPRQKQMKTFNIKIKPSKCTTCKKQVVKVKFSSRNKMKKLKRQKQEPPKHTDLIDILNILTYSEDEISSVASQCSMAGSAQITLNFLQEMDEFLQKQDLAYEELKSTKNNLKVEIKSPKMNIPRDIPPILLENDVSEEKEDYPDIIIKNIERKSSSTVAVQVVKFFSISKCLNIVPRLISNVSSSLNLNFFGSKDPVCLEKVNKRRKDICQRKFPPDQTLAKVEGWIKSSNFESESTVIDEYNEPLKNLSKSTVENDSDSVITSVTKEEWVRKMERVNQGMEIKTKHSTAVNSHESVESMAKLVETLKSNNTIKGVAKINSISSPWELYEGRTKSKSEPPDQFSTIIEAEEPDMPEVKRTENVFKIRTNVDKTDIFASTVPPPRPSSRHKRHVDTSFLNKPSTALSQDRKARKRKTLEKVGASVEDRQRRLEDIVSNRVDRHNKRRQQRKMQTEQFIKSMQMLQSNCKPDHSEPFEDYSIYLYRQTAPNFEDRVRNLEKQFIYVPDKESRVVPAQTKRETDEDFAARIKDLEDKWREPVSVEKKPKDLLRAIGKIETSDWNIKEIEKKIIENKLGKTVNKDKEKVPKWSREQFLARQTKMERQHIDRQNSTEVKFADIDRNIKQLELKLKEGSVRDLNQHKVASITEKLVGKTTEPPTTTAQSSKPIQKSSSRTVIPISQGSEFCHFCSKRVYLVERLTAEGRIFHTGCFRCQYCHTSLRLGTYMFDREGLYEHRFYCAQHFGMPGEISRPEKKVVEIQETPQKKIVSNVLGVDLLDRVQTPERIEFSNLSTGHISSDHDESPSPIDEDEWTDRNNINSVVDSDSSDDSSSTSDTDSDDEAYEEALEEPITKEGTLRWAERYKKRYSRKDHESNSDGYSSSDHFSYYENSSGDDDSDTATEGEEEIRARELRKQEVRVEPPIDAGTDTEVKPLSNYPFDSNDSNLVSNQTPCTVDMPDILNNTLKVSKSSDNMSSTNEQFNSAESELDDMYKHEMRDIRNQEPPTPNSLSKSSTMSSISSTPVKRNFVLPPKERRSSFGKEFVPVVEQEPLLVIKRTPSKINLPPEIGKPKVQVKTNVDSAKKYFGELRKPFISKPPIDKSKKPPIIKQASLPERSTITVAHAQNKEESKEGRRESIFNFEPEENDLEEIDNYIENLMKGEKQVLHPVKAGKNEDEREEEKVSSSIEDLLKALEVETNVEENEIVEVKPEEKIEDLLNWIEELDHKAEDSHITSSLKPDKYKNLENVLKKPREVDNVIHKLSKDNITQFENHLLGKNQKVPEDNNDNYQLSKSKTDVNCNKPRNSVDLDAVKKVDIKKVLEKFENNEGQQQDFKQPRRSIVVPKNIVKRNSFANFSFNRSFEKDDKQPMYDQHRDSIGSKDFKMRAEMFEKKLKRFDDQNDETRFNPSQEGFEGNSRRSPLSWKFNQLKSNSQSPHRTNDDSLGRSSSLLRRFEMKASSESPQRSKNASVVDQSGKPAFLKVNDSSPHRKDRDTSPSFLRKFPHLKSDSKSPNRVADNDGNLNEGVSFLEKSISSSKLLSGKTEDATGDSDDDSLKSPSLLKKILELESIRRQLQNTETTPIADGHNLNKSPVALKELDEIKPEVESKPKSIVNLVENISFLQPKTDSSQRTEDEVNLCRITSETGQDDDGNNLADINLGSRLDESNAHKSTEIDNAFSGTPFLQNLSQIPDDRSDSFYDKIQLDRLLTNTRQTKDEIVGNNHRETINSENKSDGKLESTEITSNSESNVGQGNNGNDLDFYDITLDNEAQSPVRENYFQALVTVKNIIKNLNLQQETGLNPNTEIEIQPNAIEPGFNEDVSIKGENIIEEGNREGMNLDNVVECAGDIESNLQRKEKVYQEVNDDSVLKGNENRNENIENKPEEGRICGEIEPNIDKVIEKRNQVADCKSSSIPASSSIKNQNVVDSKKLNKKPSLEFVTVEKHPLLTEKPSSSTIIDLPKIQLVESTNTNKKETSPRPVPPQRSKKEHISMIPRLTNPHASKNFIRPQQSSIRAASASPGVSRRMETAFAPVPPVRKKSSTSTAAPNLGDKNMELNQTKLNERSTSADNLGTSKRQSDTLRGKLFSKSKEKECSIQ